jgi:hypothetical protein
VRVKLFLNTLTLFSLHIFRFTSLGQFFLREKDIKKKICKRASFKNFPIINLAIFSKTYKAHNLIFLVKLTANFYITFILAQTFCDPSNTIYTLTLSTYNHIQSTTLTLILTSALLLR